MTTDTTRDTSTVTYRLRIRGELDKDFVSSFCPKGTTMVHTGGVTVLDEIDTDQSGIIGLVRHVHNLGCVILGLERR